MRLGFACKKLGIGFEELLQLEKDKNYQISPITQTTPILGVLRK